MVKAHRLAEFVDNFVQITNEEEQEKTLWEMWLHKVFDKSYGDFRQALECKNYAAPSKDEVVDIVRESKEMLDGVHLGEAGSGDGLRSIGVGD